MTCTTHCPSGPALYHALHALHTLSIPPPPPPCSQTHSYARGAGFHTMKLHNKLKRSPSSSPPSTSPPSPSVSVAPAAPGSSSPSSPSRKRFSFLGRSRSKKLDSSSRQASELTHSSSSSSSSSFSSSHRSPKSSPTAPDHHPSASSSPAPSHTYAKKGKSALIPSDQPSNSHAVRHGKGNTVENVKDEMQQVFEHIDTNGDGKISSEELRTLLSSLGDETTSEEAAQMVREVDSEGKGYLNLEEFVQLNERCLHGATEEEEMRAVFEIFDLDKDGWITAEELQEVLRRLGGALAQRTSVEDCKRMICGVDRKGTGHVDFDDFMRMMTPLAV